MVASKALMMVVLLDYLRVVRMADEKVVKMADEWAFQKVAVKVAAMVDGLVALKVCNSVVSTVV